MSYFFTSPQYRGHNLQQIPVYTCFSDVFNKSCLHLPLASYESSRHRGAPPSSIDPNASGSELGEYPGSTEIPATATAPCCTRRKTDRALPLKPFRSCFRTLTFCQFYHNSSPTLCYLVRLGARVPFISSIFAHRNSQLKTSRIHLPIPGHAMGCYGLVKAAPKFDDISL